MATAKTKETIYIDADEEITSIVGKISESSNNIIALVLPKRANVLQSIVNMKLIKRTADQNEKQVVLITSEQRLLPLAGAAGLYVASSLTSKPYLPLAPKIAGETIGSAEEIDPSTPLEKVAPYANYADEDKDSIEIDNTPKADQISEGAEKKAKKPNKKLKVPNFSKFRKRFIFGGIALALLIIGLVWALVLAPKATVTIKAKTSDVPVDISFVADPAATELDKENKVVRAQKKETEKTDSEKVPATGEKDNGNKASGKMTLKNCTASDSGVTIPAGTGISSGEFTFITQESIKLPPRQIIGLDTCITPTSDVSVIAQNPGDKYNLDPRDYSVAGFSNVLATGSAMTGGTSDKVKIVTQSDIDKAKERLNSKQNSAEDEIKNQMNQEGFVPISETFTASPSKYSPSPAANTQADEVTVTVTTKYSMIGVKKDDIAELIKDQVNQKQGDQPQNILDDGINKIAFRLSSVSNQLSQGQTAYGLQTTAVVGPDVNQDEIKQAITGKKKGEAEDILKKRQGFIEPKVELKPSWVGSVPKPSKITIIIQEADGTTLNQ